MTPEQIALVKRIAADIAPFEPGDSGYQVFTPDDIRALLDMLVDAEARGDRAEFYRYHKDNPTGFCAQCVGLGYLGSECHAWTESDWQNAVRARYGME